VLETSFHMIVHISFSSVIMYSMCRLVCELCAFLHHTPGLAWTRASFHLELIAADATVKSREVHLLM